jgi:hypothetical protein
MAQHTTKTTILVGQRLIRWDGEAGYIALNTAGRGVVFGLRDVFVVQWKDGESGYLTLAQFEEEGVRLGKGRMPWAR